MILNSFQLQKWEIDPLSNTEYDVEDISWEREGVVFTLIPEGINKSKFNHRLQLIWDSSLIVAYHVTDETYRSDCWGLDFLNNGRFYITKDSTYIDSLKRKSPLFPDEVIHFTIIGTNTIVDLLAKDYPMIRTIELSTNERNNRYGKERE